MDIDELIAREAIRQTITRYSVASDAVACEDMAATFTEDGLLQLNDGTQMRGRADIASRLLKLKTAMGQGVDPKVVQRHHLTTSTITFSSRTEAIGKTYYLAISEKGPTFSGTYSDDLVRVADAWLIKRRLIKMDWIKKD